MIGLLEQTYIYKWLEPLIILLSSFLLGLFVEKVIFAKIRRIAANTSWELDDAIIESIRGLPFFWIMFLGMYWLLLRLPLSLNIQANIQKAILVLFLVSVIFATAQITGNVITYFLKRVGRFFAESSLVILLTKCTVYIIGFLVILQTSGISIMPILAALGIGGLAVSLALQDSLSNLFAGLQILLSRQIQLGNYIRLDSGEEGYVVDISLRNTTIRQLANNIIIIPNAKMASTIITNFDKDDSVMSVLVDVGVSYSSYLPHVEQVVVEVGKEIMQDVQGAVQDFEPFIRYHTFGDSSINFTVILRVKDYVAQYLVKHEFIKRLKNRFDKEGIVIPFPIRTVYIQNRVESMSMQI